MPLGFGIGMLIPFELPAPSLAFAEPSPAACATGTEIAAASARSLSALLGREVRAEGRAVSAAVRDRGSHRGSPTAPLAVLARQPLAGGYGLALIEAGTRRLLVGFGRDGVQLVADLGAAEGRTP